MNKYIFFISLFIAVSVLFSTTFAQNHNQNAGQGNLYPYEISLEVSGYDKDKYIYLGYYFLGQPQIVDSLKVNQANLLKFNRSHQKIQPGEYYFALQNKKPLFDFILNQSTPIVFKTKFPNFSKSMQVFQSKDNEIYMQYNRYFKAYRENTEEINKGIKQAENKKDTQRVQLLKKKLESEREKLKNYRAKLRKNNPGLYVSKLLKMLDEVEIPNPPSGSNAIVQAVWKRNYLLDHHFDNFDLQDARTIRNKYFYTAFNKYWETIVPKEPNIIIKYLDKFYLKCEASQTMSEFFLFNRIVQYQHPLIPGGDLIFVHLNKKYFADKKKTPWIHDNMRFQVNDVAQRMAYCLTGKRGSNVSLPDSTNIKKSLYDIRSQYTLIAIFDPTCFHCKKTMPKIKPIYDRLNKRKTQQSKFFELFSIDYNLYVDDAKQELENNWRNFLVKYNVPGINVRDANNSNGNFRVLYNVMAVPSFYLLDKNKKILSKQFKIEDLEKIIDGFERR